MYVDPLLILFGWWLGCNNVCFGKAFHAADGVIEKLGLNFIVEQIF